MLSDGETSTRTHTYIHILPHAIYTHSLQRCLSWQYFRVHWGLIIFESAHISSLLLLLLLLSLPIICAYFISVQPSLFNFNMKSSLRRIMLLSAYCLHFDAFVCLWHDAFLPFVCVNSQMRTCLTLSTRLSSSHNKFIIKLNFHNDFKVCVCVCLCGCVLVA